MRFIRHASVSVTRLAVTVLSLMLALTPVRAVAVDRPVSSNSLVFTMLELRLAAAAADTLYDPLVLTGRATWYDARKNDAWFTERPRPGAEGRNQDGAPYRYYAAAGPALREARDFRWGKEPYEVILRNPATGREITVTVVDWCQCHGGEAGNERLIDLAPAAFKALGVPLARGVQRIELRFVKSGITLEELLLSPAPGAIPGDAPFGTDELDAPWSAEEPDGEFLPPSPF